MQNFNRAPNWRANLIPNQVNDDEREWQSRAGRRVDDGPRMRPRPSSSPLSYQQRLEQNMNSNPSQTIPRSNRYPQYGNDVQRGGSFQGANQFKVEQMPTMPAFENRREHNMHNNMYQRNMPNQAQPFSNSQELRFRNTQIDSNYSQNRPAMTVPNHRYPWSANTTNIPHADPPQPRFNIHQQNPRNFPPMNLPMVPPILPWQPPMPIPGLSLNAEQMPVLQFDATGKESEQASKVRKEREVEAQDKKLIENWLLQRNIQRYTSNNFSCVSDIPVKKLSEGKSLITEFLAGIEGLSICKDFLAQNCNIDKNDWLPVAERVQDIKKHLESLKSTLFSKDYVKSLIKLRNRRLKKRGRQKRLRETRAKQKIDGLRKAVVWDQQIDEWRQNILSDINKRTLTDSLKSEAGKSLIEVRKKKSESSKYLEKLTSIRELRRIRRETALQRGIFIFGKEDEKFEKKVDGLLSLTKARIDNYKDEEKTLLVMLEEEKEQIQREVDKKRKRLMKNEHLRLFGFDPQLEASRYWLQAEENAIALVQVRRLWDVYIVPPTISGADKVPDGWVEPEPGKNSGWNKYLRKRRIST